MPPGRASRGCTTTIPWGWTDEEAAATVRQQPRLGRRDNPPRTGLLQAARGAAVTPVHVDRLRRQPRTRKRDRGPHARRDLCAPQRGERGGAHRPELPVGVAVRGGR